MKNDKLIFPLILTNLNFTFRNIDENKELDVKIEIYHCQTMKVVKSDKWIFEKI